MRIFDTFLFGGEVDLLEHRLRENWEGVDVFVLVEAAQTFRGAQKPMVFSEHAERFAWAAAKLRPVLLRGLGAPDLSPWSREALQRDAIALGLRDADEDDVVLILDADEIPSASLLKRLREGGLDRPHRLAMTRHYEFPNRVAPASSCCPSVEAPFAFSMGRQPPEGWDALAPRWRESTGVVARVRDLRGDVASALPPRSPYELRRSMHDAPVIGEAGRHLVSVGAQAMGPRLARLSHAELADARSLGVEHLARARRHGVHHHGWWYAEAPAGPLPDDLVRLVERSGGEPGDALPRSAMRRLVRTWAWLRHWPALGDRTVAIIDRHFERMLPVLALPLATAGLARRLAACFGWRWFGRLSADTRGHGHG